MCVWGPFFTLLQDQEAYKRNRIAAVASRYSVDVVAIWTCPTFLPYLELIVGPTRVGEEAHIRVPRLAIHEWTRNVLLGRVFRRSGGVARQLRLGPWTTDYWRRQNVRRAPRHVTRKSRAPPRRLARVVVLFMWLFCMPPFCGNQTCQSAVCSESQFRTER